VVCFVTVFQAAQNRDGVFNARLSDKHLLEAALQGGVFFDVFAVLVQRGRTNQAQLAASQHGFEHVGCRDRPLAATSAHQGVELVDKGDDLAFGVVDFFQHGFQSLFELTAILRTRHQSGHVQGDQLLVF